MTKDKLQIITIKFIASLGYIAYLLASKPIGILVLSILLYNFSCALGFANPYSFSELILWVDQLPENSKTTVFTSIITISGFLIAFSINSATQKQQLMSQMRIEASKDVESFFNEVSNNITSANIYAKYLIEIINHINNGADKATLDFHFQNVIKETNKYYILQKKIQEQAIEVHRFQGQYSIIFASSWSATTKLETAVTAFGEIANNIWFNTPILLLEDPEIEKTYLNQINEEQCNNYINSYEKNRGIISGSIGGLSGSMLGTITGINFSFLINLLKMANK